MSREISYYAELITSQYRGSTKLLAWLAACLEPIHDASTLADSLVEAFDLGSAVGAQIDTLGVIAGISRTVPFQPSGGVSPVLDDDTYRWLIRATVARNYWDGTVGGIKRLWDTLFTDNAVHVHDNQDMTMDVICVGTFSSIQKDLIQNDLIIPRPEGVQINYTFGKLFSYDEETSAMAGYDESYWGL
jgi:hypothetical protein